MHWPTTSSKVKKWIKTKESHQSPPFTHEKHFKKKKEKKLGSAHALTQCIKTNHNRNRFTNHKHKKQFKKKRENQTGQWLCTDPQLPVKATKNLYKQNTTQAPAAQPVIKFQSIKAFEREQTRSADPEPMRPWGRHTWDDAAAGVPWELRLSVGVWRALRMAVGRWWLLLGCSSAPPSVLCAGSYGLTGSSGWSWFQGDLGDFSELWFRDFFLVKLCFADNEC